MWRIAMVLPAMTGHAGPIPKSPSFEKSRSQ